MSRIYVVGMGPGNMEEMTPRAKNAIAQADLIIGYSTYIELIREHFPGKELVSSGMTREVERCRLVLQKAEEGSSVALISSGDSGIYGMAGIMLEVVRNAGSSIPVEVIPGISAANAAASVLGAPLMHDFAVISLSDLMTPWELICKRLEAAAQADFVVCLYNPKSKGRPEYINIAQEILLKYKAPNTPVGLVKNACREGEQHTVTTLGELSEQEIDMFTTVIVGNSQTYTADGKIITPRGYSVG